MRRIRDGLSVLDDVRRSGEDAQQEARRRPTSADSDSTPRRSREAERRLQQDELWTRRP